MNQLEILKYCNWISKSIETKMDNPIIIILSVFFVDHVIFFVYSRHKTNAPTICSEPSIPFLKKEKKFLLLESLLNSTSAKNVLGSFPPLFSFVKKYWKKSHLFLFFPLTLYSVLPATYLLFLNKLQSTYYVLYGIVQYTSVKKTYFFPVTFFSSQFWNTNKIWHELFRNSSSGVKT